MIKWIKSISSFSKFREETLRDRRLLHKTIEEFRQRSGNIEQELIRSKNIIEELSNKIHPSNRDHNGIFHFESDGVVSRVVVNPDIYGGELAKKILRLMSPQDITGMSFVRIGNDHDGGYIMLDRGLHDTVAYSFGISNDVSWDQGMVDRGCQIYQFDHTINNLPYESPNFHWQKLGISPKTGGEFISIPDIIDNNAHRDRDDIILKMDIEGAEWDVFEAIDPEDLGKFSQIVVELHSFVTGGVSHLERVIPILEKINQTHQSIHFHANNYSWLGIIGGVALPDVFELTYVRRADHQFEPCTREFPTPLDRPCRGDAPDYFLRV